MQSCHSITGGKKVNMELHLKDPCATLDLKIVALVNKKKFRQMGIELKTKMLVFLCNNWVRFNELGLEAKPNAAADMLFNQRQYYATNGPSLTTKSL